MSLKFVKKATHMKNTFLMCCESGYVGKLVVLSAHKRDATLAQHTIIIFKLVYTCSITEVITKAVFKKCKITR